MSSYRDGYKNTNVDVQEQRRKMQEENAHMQKQERKDELSYRRNLNLSEESVQGGDTSDSIKQEDSSDSTAEIEITSEMVAALYKDDVQQQLRSTQKFREILSKESDISIDEVIKTGVVTKFVEYLQNDENPILQFEAAWALVRIAYSCTSFQMRSILEAGSVPVFIRLLDSKYEDIQEKAILALGNIAGDSDECRDYVLSKGILFPLLHLLSKSRRISMTRNAVFALFNLCRWKELPPKFKEVSTCLPVLSRLLFHKDEIVLKDTCWALLYFTDDSKKKKIQAEIDAGVCHGLFKLLVHSSQSVVLVALNIVGSIAAGNDVQTQVVLNCNALQYLLRLLLSPSEDIRMRACWTISNITAGNRQQIQAVIDANIFPVLVEIIQRSAEIPTRSHAARAITNATFGGSQEQIRLLAEQKCIPPLCELLTVSDADVIELALDGLENILRTGERDSIANRSFNSYAVTVKECDGLTKLNLCMYHENDKINQKAFDVKKYL